MWNLLRCDAVDGGSNCVWSQKRFVGKIYKTCENISYLKPTVIHFIFNQKILWRKCLNLLYICIFLHSYIELLFKCCSPIWSTQFNVEFYFYYYLFYSQGLCNNHHNPIFKKYFWGLPCGPLVKTLLQGQGLWVQSLVGELRSHMSHGLAKNIFFLIFKHIFVFFKRNPSTGIPFPIHQSFTSRKPLMYFCF